MADNQGIESLYGSTVHDSAGEKVGKIEEVYIDESTHLPTWASVKTGLFGLSRSLVPLAGARHSGDRLDVTVTKDKIKDAPHLDADDGLSVQQIDDLLRHYGLTAATAGWDAYGKHAEPSTASGAVDHHGARDQRHDASVVRHEEQLNVNKDRVEAGKARLRKYVVTEQQQVTVPVTREEVRVVREPISSNEAVPGGRIGEDSVEAILHEEKVNVTKEAVPVERVGLAVDQVQDKHTVNETVRKEQVDTEGTYSKDKPQR